MNYLVVYDVATTTPAGKKRLRTVARACEGFGQRVQYSVFEVCCSKTDLARLVAKLGQIVEPDEDSLRIYPVGVASFDDVLRVGIERALPSGDAWTI